MHTRYISAALGVLLGTALPALAGTYDYDYRVTTSHDTYQGRYVMKPGCCANAPRPVEQLDTRTYHYPNGYKVIVYPYGNGTGYQPFYWERQGH